MICVKINLPYSFKIHSKEVKSMQKTVKMYKKGVAFENTGGKSCEIKDGGHEMAAMVLMIINFKCINIIYYHNIIAAILWLPPLISQPFHQGFLKATPILYSLAVFAWIIISTVQQIDYS